MALDIHLRFGCEVTEELLENRTWHWFLARARMLLNMPDTLTRKEAQHARP